MKNDSDEFLSDSSSYVHSVLQRPSRVESQLIFQNDDSLNSDLRLHRISRLRTTTSPSIQDPKMSTSVVGRLEFWLGITVSLVAVLGAVITATWTISSTISSKNDSLRTELNQNISNSRQELTTRIDRLEDKVDGGFKSTSEQLADLKIVILTQKGKSESSSN